ncbi:MAG: amidohydrolase family protein [Bryobacteraceae bacterium]|jgi:predicted TIM-barrel fold metal-dependent hydrolase
MKGGIDFHVHPVLIREMIRKYPELAAACRETYYCGNAFQPLEVMLAEFDLVAIDRAVLLPVDATTSRGAKIYSNEQIAELCGMSDRFIGFASVDPHQESAPQQLRQAIAGLGLRGLKLDPAMQDFEPSDKRYYPLYETAAELRIPILFHAGLSFAPRSKLRQGHPTLFEDIAADFPGLNIVLAHLAWPWVVEAVALAIKYPNVYLDTSALYFDNPYDFLSYAMTKQVPLTVFERTLRKQIVFGSNNPRSETKTMARAIRGLGFSEDCLELVFRVNAERLLAGERAC